MLFSKIAPALLCVLVSRTPITRTNPIISRCNNPKATPWRHIPGGSHGETGLLVDVQCCE